MWVRRQYVEKISDQKSDQNFSREISKEKSATDILQVYFLKIPANIMMSSRHCFQTSWRYFKHLSFKMKYVFYLTHAIFQQHCWNIIFRRSRGPEIPNFLVLRQPLWNLMESLNKKTVSRTQILRKWQLCHMNNEPNINVVGNWPMLENWGAIQVKLFLLHL